MVNGINADRPYPRKEAWPGGLRGCEVEIVVVVVAVIAVVETTFNCRQLQGPLGCRCWQSSG